MKRYSAASGEANMANGKVLKQGSELNGIFGEGLGKDAFGGSEERNRTVEQQLVNEE
jgi:hypothetical protein